MQIIDRTSFGHIWAPFGSATNVVRVFMLGSHTHTLTSGLFAHGIARVRHTYSECN